MSRVILFDLDGTLTDSGPGIIKCVQYALNYMGKPESNSEKLRCFVGPPLHEQFMEYGGFTSEEADTAVEQYRERYSSIGMYENAVYEGITDILNLLKEKGKILGVASSKPTVFVEEILCHFEIRNYFDVVVGSELDGRRTEKDEVIEDAIKQLGFDKCREQVLMVGDRKYDVEGARTCGIQCIGAAYGYGGTEELERAGAVYIAKCVEDLKILAESDDDGEEPPVARSKSDKARSSNHGYIERSTTALAQKKGRKKKATPQEILQMIWDVFFPMLVHFLCMLVVSLLGVSLAGFLYRGAGTGYMEVVQNLPWLTSVMSAVTAIAAIFILWKYYMKDQHCFKISVNVWNWRFGTACALSAIGVGMLWNKLIAISGIREFFQRYEEVAANSYENQNWFVLVICIGIIASIGEEFVFRGLIYQRAKAHFGVGWAIGISSAMFAAYHGNVTQFIYAVALGILFAALYERSGSLLAPIAAHIAANIFSISYEYIVDFMIKQSDYGEVILIAVMTVLAAGALFYIFVYGKEKNESSISQ